MKSILVILALLTQGSFANEIGMSEKLSPTLTKKLEESVVKHLESVYEKGVGISLELQCQKHVELKPIFCTGTFSTGLGTLGIISVRFDKDKITLLDLFDA